MLLIMIILASSNVPILITLIHLCLSVFQLAPILISIIYRLISVSSVLQVVHHVLA